MQSLSSVLAEENIMGQLRDLRARPVQFETAQLQQVARDFLPIKRVNTAERYLTEVYGHRPVPPTEYLDKVFGLDTVVTYRGWVIGLDITLNPDAIASKYEKLQGFGPAFNALGIDALGVINAHEDLKTQLTQIIRSA